MTPGLLDTLFPPNIQQDYIATLQRQGRLTRRRAECFVRLWGYLLLKTQAEQLRSQPPVLQELLIPPGFISCSHREASELFYAQEERGSDRAAGLMIDRLVALRFLDKNYDGQTLSLQVRPIPELLSLLVVEPIPELHVDAFNPRTDAVLVAQLITQAYQDLIKHPGKATFRISRNLRTWASHYSKGMRVLRRADTLNPVGAVVLSPVLSESEQYFFQSPSLGYFWADDCEGDLLKIAKPGDLTCTALYMRAWIVDTPYATPTVLDQFIQETQRLLGQLQEDFPSLCDIYATTIQPNQASFQKLMGFERVLQISQPTPTWTYISFDRYLALDPQKITEGLPPV
ncbi:MAG: hypothetical protein VKJ24_08745 [Synechococcales bacterium]|nr:hypothetical protein [Synechococcales bacterium]